MFKIPQIIIDALGTLTDDDISDMKQQNAFETFGCVEGIHAQIESSIDLYPVFLIYYAHTSDPNKLNLSSWHIRKYSVESKEFKEKV